MKRSWGSKFLSCTFFSNRLQVRIICDATISLSSCTTLNLHGRKYINLVSLETETTHIPVSRVAEISEGWSVTVPECLQTSHLRALFSSDAVFYQELTLWFAILICLDTQDFVRTGEALYLRMNLSLHFMLILFRACMFQQQIFADQ